MENRLKKRFMLSLNPKLNVNKRLALYLLRGEMRRYCVLSNAAILAANPEGVARATNNKK